MTAIRTFIKRVPFAVVVLLLSAATAGAAGAMRSSEPPAQATSGVHEIKLADRMTPEAITIAPGESIQIDPKDGKTHVIGKGQGKKGEVSAGETHNHQAGSEQEVAPDEGFKVTFNEPGIFYFHDHDNPDASVAVVVTRR